MYVCIYVYTYIRMYVLYTHTHTHTHTHTLNKVVSVGSEIKADILAYCVHVKYRPNRARVCISRDGCRWVDG